MQNGRKNAWNDIAKEQKAEIFSFCDEYKDYITECKTEWEAFDYCETVLKDSGFVYIEDVYAQKKQLTQGDKVYAKNRKRGLCACVIGKNGVKNGLRILAAHIDSPNVYMRHNPLFEEPGVVCAKTYSRGSIKEYQWVTIPLAMHANIIMPDNSVKNIVVGEKDDDPIFYADDLSMHLSSEQLKKSMNEGIKGEDLNIILGSIPDSKQNSQKSYLLDLIKEKYGVTERQFYNAEVYFTPAFKARDVGFDRSMIAAYGQDDRVCVYAALNALIDTSCPQNTAVIMLQDKEEVGNFGNTSASSHFYNEFLKDIYELTVSDFNRHDYATMQRLTKVINGDVTTLIQPIDHSMMDVENSAILGGGTCIDKYISGALYDYLGRLTNLLDDNGVAWQYSSCSKSIARTGSSTCNSFHMQNMDVVNMGPGLYAMHGFYELVSKVDLYMTYKAYKAFIGKEGF